MKRIEKQLDGFPDGLEADAAYLSTGASTGLISGSPSGRPGGSNSSGTISSRDEYIMRNSVVHRYYEKDLLAFLLHILRDCRRNAIAAGGGVAGGGVAGGGWWRYKAVLPEWFVERKAAHAQVQYSYTLHT